jgi:hypothetical protein
VLLEPVLVLETVAVTIFQLDITQPVLLLQEMDKGMFRLEVKDLDTAMISRCQRCDLNHKVMAVRGAWATALQTAQDFTLLQDIWRARAL